jgi:hypothetical protein
MNHLDAVGHQGTETKTQKTDFSISYWLEGYVKAIILQKKEEKGS